MRSVQVRLATAGAAEGSADVQMSASPFLVREPPSMVRSLSMAEEGTK